MQPDDFFAAVEAKRQPAPVFPRATRREAMTSTRYECDHSGCDRDFGTEQGLNVHKCRAHGARMPKPAKPAGGGVVKPENTPNHTPEIPRARETATPAIETLIRPAEYTDHRDELIRTYASLAIEKAQRLDLIGSVDVVEILDRIKELAS